MAKIFKDCQLKGLILRSILDGNTTSPLIFQDIKYPHSYTNSFFRELKFLKDSGYISRRKVSGVSVYSLTKKGRGHALNPLIYKEHKNRYVTAVVSSMLMDNEKFRKAVEKEAHKIAKHPIVSVSNPVKREYVAGSTEYVPFAVKSNGLQSPSDTGFIVQEKPNTIDELMEKGDLDRDLKEELSNLIQENNILKRQLERELELRKGKPVVKYVKEHVYVDSATNQPINPELLSKRMEKRNKRRVVQTSIADHRKRLANRYCRYWLDVAFFNAWGNAIPVKLKNVPWCKPGSIEIVSSRNDEWKRGHISHKLSPEQIRDAKFSIQVFNEGIEVMGRGMKKPKFMKY